MGKNSDTNAHNTATSSPETTDAFADVQSVFIELTSRCNMNCRFCPYPVLKREKKDMPHEYVLKILEELKGRKKDVTFHVLGEPLLNRHFFEYAQLCDKNGINYWLVTNGLGLTPMVLEKLFSLKNLQNVEISFHTMTEETFALRGCDISFDKYLGRIRDAVFCQKRLESDVKINIDVMYDTHLLHGTLWKNFSIERWRGFTQLMASWSEELQTVYPLARSRWPRFYEGKKKIFCRHDHYLYRRFSDIPGDLFDALPPNITWIRWEIFPNVFITLKKFFFFTKNKDYLRHALDGGLAGVTPAHAFNCGWPCHLVILSNGDISFCCLDYEGELSCGNIESMTLAEAVQSDKRRLLISKPDAFALCRECKGEISLEDFSETKFQALDGPSSTITHK